MRPTYKKIKCISLNRSFWRRLSHNLCLLSVASYSWGRQIRIIAALEVQCSNTFSCIQTMPLVWHTCLYYYAACFGRRLSVQASVHPSVPGPSVRSPITPHLWCSLPSSLSSTRDSNSQRDMCLSRPLSIALPSSVLKPTQRATIILQIGDKWNCSST